MIFILWISLHKINIGAFYLMRECENA